MEEERTTTRSTHRARSEGRTRADEPNTLLNAVVGAAVTVLTAPLLPFAAIFGGGVAGYLQRGDLAEGAKVGAASGLLAAIPAFLVFWLVVSFLFMGLDLLALTSVFAVVAFAAVVGYLAGAGALGGALGSYLRREL